MTWDSDSLLQKAKLYISRAQSEERDGPLFPMWLTLALELLGRAAVAMVHPALLADHRDPENVMFAFGLKPTGKSVAAATVFRRCQLIVPNFTAEDLAFAIALMDRRNEELHSGALAFDNWPTRLWLGGYFRLASLLADSLGTSLEDLFGTDEATAGKAMIKAEAERTASGVKAKIEAARQHWHSLEEADRASAVQTAGRLYEQERRPGRRIKCPSCKTVGRLIGEQVAESDPRADEGEIVQDVVFLPAEFTCAACGLMLDGYSELHASGFGGQFTREHRSDPVEFFNIDWRDYDIDWRELAAQELGEDYGNE